MSSRKRSVANTPSLMQKSSVNISQFSQSASYLSADYDTADSDDNRQVSFRSRGLTSDDVQSIAIFFECVSELDLSENRIDIIPRGIPPNVAALNLSKNRFKNLIGFDQLTGLCMLRLHDNILERTWGLQACVSLEHLDLSNNNISVVEGFETLANLKTLVLSQNNIKKMGAIRPLSFNTQLQELCLRNNPITSIPKYRGAIKHLISSLKHLDGSAIFFSDGNRGGSYGVRHQVRLHTSSLSKQSLPSMPTMSPEHAPEIGSPWNEVSHRWNVQDGVIPSPPRTQGWSAYNDSIVAESFVAEDDPSELPWNRCPYPIPKDRQGREMYEAPPAPTSPLRSPVTSHRTLKKQEMKRTARNQEKAAIRQSPAPWSTSKHAHPPNVPVVATPSNMTPSTGSTVKASTKSGSSRSRPKTPAGLSAKAKAANIQYPICQPKFSPPHNRKVVPPPPPPPPPNKYKITLGKNAPIISTKAIMKTPVGSSGSPKPIRGHTHAPRHDIIRVHNMDADWSSEDGAGYEDMSDVSPERRQAMVSGIPIMAADGLRRAVSPPKSTPALHPSLCVDHPTDDAHGARKVIHHYNAHMNDSGGSLLPPHWSPPPLPFEASARSRRNDDHDEEYAEVPRGYGGWSGRRERKSSSRYDGGGGSSDEDGNMSDGPYSDVTLDPYENRVDPVEEEGSDTVSEALRLIYDQKRKIVDHFREKRMAAEGNKDSKDTLLLIRTAA